MVALGAAMLALALLVLAAAPTDAVDIVPLPELGYQTIAGWGQGSMDQANVPWHTQLSAAGREQLLDWLYTLDDGGLGLTLCRVPMPAGDHPAHQHMSRRPFGTVSPRGWETAPGVWDWSGAEPLLWHPRGAAERGAELLAYWNSPPWWMTVSGCSAGESTGRANNLKPGLEDEFARHMVDVLRHYRDAFGLTFRYVCPINEPESDWWREGGGQEGTHCDARQAALIVAALRRRLDAAGLAARICGPEAAYGNATAHLDQLLGDLEGGPALDILTCHQYITSDAALRRWAVRARQAGKPLWQSEWGDWTGRGLPQALGYAAKIAQALRTMRAEVWCLWEPANLFDRAGDRLARREAFAAVAHVTRVARPGAQVIDVADDRLCSIAVRDAGGGLAIVSFNDGATPVTARYRLARLRGWRARECRRTGPGEGLAEVAPEPIRGGVAVELPPRSIVTLVLEAGGLSVPAVANPGFEALEAGWTFEPAAPPEQAGVQDNYPVGGFYDGYVHARPDGGCRLSQTVTGLTPGARYLLGAMAASSNVTARLSATGGERTETVDVVGGGYRLYQVAFTPGPDGIVQIAYDTPPAGLGADGGHPWATLDNVFLAPAE